MRAGGGTHMADAVAAALSTDVARGRHRYVFFMTDGYVGNEDEIIGASDAFVKALEGRGQRARVFGFGVGSSVNRYLLEGVSRAGKGIAVYATTREDPQRGVDRFYHYIDRAVLTDVVVDYGDLRVSEVYPSAMPDLFASHPVILHGRYAGTPTGTIEVRGKAGDRAVSTRVDVRQAKTRDAPSRVMGTLWARAKVADLEERLWEGSDPDAQRQITELGLAHDLVTRFTSLVAVDTSRRVGRGDPRTLVQPVEAPEGVDVEMAGGVRQEAALELAPEPMDDPSEPDAAYASDAMSSSPGLYAVEKRRGCGCRAAGSHGSAWGLAAFVSLALALMARRRRPGPGG
jgi:Ca-activated chloride channel homolog